MATKFWVGGDATSPNDWATAANWSPAVVPIAGDDVIIQGAVNIDGYDASAVTLNNFTVEDGYTGTIGSRTTYLDITMGAADIFTFSGRGRAYIDVNASAVDMVIHTTASQSQGQAGLYLLGTAIDDVQVRGGSVKFEGSTVTTFDAKNGSNVEFDSGCTVTNLNNTGGTVVSEGTSTNVKATGGTTTINGTAAVTSLECRGGTLFCNTTGTVTTLTVADTGSVDMRNLLTARTVTTLDINGGSIRYNPNVITVTNAITSDGALRITG